MREYTQKQQEYIDSVDGNAHQSAIKIIGELDNQWQMTQIERARKERGELVESINKIVSDKINLFCKKYNVTVDSMQLRTKIYGQGIKDIEIFIDYEREYDNRNK